MMLQVLLWSPLPRCEPYKQPRQAGRSSTHPHFLFFQENVWDYVRFRVAVILDIKLVSRSFRRTFLKRFIIEYCPCTGVHPN